MLVKLDFQNAFNTVHRQPTLQECAGLFPGYSPFLWQMYSTPSNLVYQSECIAFESEIQQGDPVGPMLFCATIYPVVPSLQSPLNSWYMTVSWGRSKCRFGKRACSDCIAEKHGLQLNFAKWETFVFGGTEEESDRVWQSIENVIPGMLRLGNADLCLLSAPMTDAAIVPASRKNL